MVSVPEAVCREEWLPPGRVSSLASGVCGEKMAREEPIPCLLANCVPDFAQVTSLTLSLFTYKMRMLWHCMLEVCDLLFYFDFMASGI